MPPGKLNRWLGVLALLACCATLFLWIPFDVDTGMIEKVRRQVRLGDAFAPTIAALIIGMGGCLLLLQRTDKPTNSEFSAEQRSHGENADNNIDETNRILQRTDLAYAIYLVLLVAISLLIMRYAGPLALWLIEGEQAEYRLLRDTRPWKYIGFAAGGLFMVMSLIAFVEHRIRASHLLVAVIIVLLLIAVYDLPFDDLLLPPNGDV